MISSAGIAYVFDGVAMSTIGGMVNPECEIDGDAFWVWIGPSGARMNFEVFDGQAQKCLTILLQHDPGLATVALDDPSPDGEPGVTLGEIAGGDMPTFPDMTETRTWLHGTSTARLDSILSDGLDPAHGQDRSWTFAEIAPDVVFLANSVHGAEEYAVRAARLFGGEPVILEITGEDLDPSRFVADHDFAKIPECASLRAGHYGDVGSASASLLFMGKVGYRGVVPPEAIVSRFVRGDVCDFADDTDGASPSP